jgi:NTP pyrophosphatase (non-canonical NTP hydrolase)
MREDLIPKTFEGSLSRLVEECGEVLKAIGKIQRFGETATDGRTALTYHNTVDLLMELQDLKHAISETERLGLGR